MMSAHTIGIWLQKPGKGHANADVLTCLPLPEHPKNIPQSGETVLLESLNTTPVNAKHVKEWMDKDQILSKVRAKVQQGDQTCDDHPQIQPYVKWINEFSV